MTKKRVRRLVVFLVMILANLGAWGGPSDAALRFMYCTKCSTGGKQYDCCTVGGCGKLLYGTTCCVFNESCGPRVQ